MHDGGQRKDGEEQKEDKEEEEEEEEGWQKTQWHTITNHTDFTARTGGLALIPEAPGGRG
ncbi:hypothetical protein E2C01_048993 [Portunus trituberculatus]|uniref:Uncharacterized protein n=1 Tax=Portunus trituberculatus TaxID=210409 RepID=A0A5B7G528_PORTR|nr:hypothetical protein [Portunus trituberculatus]